MNLIEKEEGITFNDIIIYPSGKIDFTVDQVQTKTKLTKNITLNTGIVSSPMDKVTEEKMAIAMALEGGIGIIHRNNTIEQQVEMVKKVKRYQNGFIKDPIVFSPDDCIKDTLKYRFNTFPIVSDEKLVGLVTSKETEFKDENTRLENIMIIDVITASAEDTNLKEAQEIIKNNNINILPLLNNEGKIESIVTKKDLINLKKYPNASINNDGQLLVGAAVSTHMRDRKRIDKLVKSGVDVIVIDSSNGWSDFQYNTIKYIKNNYKSVDIIGGNVVTGEGAKFLIEAGVDAIRVGMGSGSICITQRKLGVGRPQLSAIYEIYQVASKYGIPIIADGGITSSADIVKAYAFGASCVMLGSMLAATDQSPGQTYEMNGVKVKNYRGMGSLEVLNKEDNKERYFLKDKIVTQGVSGTVTYKGSVHDFIPLKLQEIKHSLQDIGCISIDLLQGFQNMHKLRIGKISLSSQLEGKVHNLYSYNNN